LSEAIVRPEPANSGIDSGVGVFEPDRHRRMVDRCDHLRGDLRDDDEIGADLGIVVGRGGQRHQPALQEAGLIRIRHRVSLFSDRHPARLPDAVPFNRLSLATAAR
jgi:hypothetical protein